MEPEKLKYNIRDFAVATCEKRKAAHLSPVRYLNGYLLTQQKHKILVSLFLSFAKIQKIELCK